MWVRHEKHCTRNTLKVKGQGHKVMRRSSTKTLNISLKRHSVVEMHLSYRKSRSPERMTGSNFWPEVHKYRVCACAVKICSKLAYSVVKSPQFQSFYKKSWSLNTMVRAVFRPRAGLTLFLRMRTKKSPKHSENVFWQKSYSPVFPCYRKSGSPKRMARSDFWP